ncbi:MAG: DUF3014 domain-containing protein [Xanthomonadales bacterium]|nr:DUF3014 domain-containing protein [Xanthomonadales bacterium]
MKKTVPFLLLIILFAAAAWYSLVRKPDPVHELPPPTLLPATPSDIQQPVPEPGDQPADVEPQPVPEPLPMLNESDTEVIGAMAELTGANPLAVYLVKDQVISRMVATIDSLDARQVPLPANPVKHPEGKFLTTVSDDKTLLARENFDRYDAYISLLQVLDGESLLGFYTRYYPLLQQAWEENGGQGAFNDRLLDVIDHLLATPEVEGDIYLVKPEAVYLFEDPDLEALTAGQKILLRMGPGNMAVVKAKLAEIRDMLNSD